MTPSFQGEVMLLGWTETHNGGATVKFLLSDPSELEAFKTMTVRKGKVAGQRLACVLVEIGDDEKPVVHEQKPKGGELSRLAGIWCKDVRFHDWSNAANEEEARQFMLDTCMVSSRADLDNDDSAAQIFHNLIRIPFAEYLREVA